MLYLQLFIVNLCLQYKTKYKYFKISIREMHTIFDTCDFYETNIIYYNFNIWLCC